MERIGVGNTAEVFSYGDQKVCKLFYTWYPKEAVEREYHNTKLLNSLGIPSPKAYELVEIDGRNGFVEDRLYGENLLLRIMRGEDAIVLTQKLVDLQKVMLQYHTSECPSYKEYLKWYCEGKVSNENVIYQRIESLPDGDHVCHGDYHPGNVWMKEDGSCCLIDFMNICHGPREYDIARTYFLISQGEVPRNMNEQEAAELKTLQAALGKKYLEMMQVPFAELQVYFEIIRDTRCFELGETE